MGLFNKTIGEIIYLAERDSDEIRRVIRQFGHTHEGHQVKKYLLDTLKAKGVQYGIIKDKSLAHVPSGHSSFHIDDNGDAQMYDH